MAEPAVKKPAKPVESGTSGAPARPADKPAPAPDSKPKEIGGPTGPEPTRYGDWERKGVAVDF
jgi:hypothetical protein